MLKLLAVSGSEGVAPINRGLLYGLSVCVVLFLVFWGFCEFTAPQKVTVTQLAAEPEVYEDRLVAVKGILLFSHIDSEQTHSGDTAIIGRYYLLRQGSHEISVYQSVPKILQPGRWTIVGKWKKPPLGGDFQLEAE